MTNKLQTLPVRKTASQLQLNDKGELTHLLTLDGLSKEHILNIQILPSSLWRLVTQIEKLKKCLC